MKSTILVTGATGYVGGRLIPELLERGAEVRALARNPGKLRGRSFAEHPGLRICQGDVLDSATLRAALHGVDAAYYLVHSMGQGGDFAELDLRAARTFSAACADAGVGRIVYLSGLGDSDDPTLSHHLASRHATGAALRETGVPVTELRAAVIVGSGSQSFEIIHDLARKLPVMITPRWVTSRSEPIAIRDVVEYLIRVLDEPRSEGETLEIGGGEILTYREMLEICGDELGRRPTMISVPILTPRFSSYWLHLVTSVDIGLARPLIEGLRNDVVTHDHRIREWIPLELTSYRNAVQRALARRSDRSQRWSSWADARRKKPASGAGQPNVRTFRDYRSFDTTLTPEQLFERVLGIGGESGYGGGVDVLWQLRGALDRALGGPGLRRGRPTGRLHEGDPLDFWRVETLDEPHRMLLVAEMLVPGEARLDLRVEPLACGGARLHQLATLTGDSPWARAYWYSILPAHNLVFDKLGAQIVGSDQADLALAGPECQATP